MEHDKGKCEAALKLVIENDNTRVLAELFTLYATVFDPTYELDARATR